MMFKGSSQKCFPCGGSRAASKAGSWYESSPGKLDAQLGSWLDATPPNDEESRLLGIIAPHAGYSYSGETASYAYAEIRRVAHSVRRVFVLGPSHHAHLQKCSITSFDTLSTPLGNLRVDSEVRDALITTGLFCLASPDVDLEEHSIEMHLPYLKKALLEIPEEAFSVVPIMVDGFPTETLAKAAATLSSYAQEPGTLFIISSDFCHWGKRFRYQPYDSSKGKVHEFISWMDGEGMKAIESQDRARFLDYLSTTGNTICGRHPIILFLSMLEFLNGSGKATQIKFLRYAQSSAALTTADSSVSYASAVVKVVSS